MVAKTKTSSGTKAINELVALNNSDLKLKLVEARQTLFNLRFSHAVAQLEKTSELKKSRRQIARILTVLKVKKA